MPRCNLTLKQKSQMIELSSNLNTEQLAKKFRVHPTTVTRTLKKQARILSQVARVNPNFKTVQTNFMSEQHDALVLAYIQAKQEAGEPISMIDVCDKAVACAKELGRNIKSTKAWWRRFKVRCNIAKSRVVKNSLGVKVLQRPMNEEGTKKPHENQQQQQQSQEATITPTEQGRQDLKKSARTRARKASSAAPVIDKRDQPAEIVPDFAMLETAQPPDSQTKSPPLTQLSDLPVNNFETVVTSSG